ncbi:MAG: hypothetical protein [Arizlama microvirus]|nr:MAG: hypothetical protein [Arizlama microvirus]
MFRSKMNKSHSRKNFSLHAGSHRRNNSSNPMRGGYRL